MTYEQSVENFVAREVYLCQTGLIEKLLQEQLFTVDDIQNVYRPFDGKLLLPCVCNRCQGEYLSLDSETGECTDCFEAHQQPQEVLEWWLVSPWLGKKLMVEGDPMLENEYGMWWGRTTSGQAIALDYIIQKIHDDVVNYTG